MTPVIVFDLTSASLDELGFERLAATAIALADRLSFPVIGYVPLGAPLTRETGALRVVPIGGGRLGRGLERAARLAADRPSLYVGAGSAPSSLRCPTVTLVFAQAEQSQQADVEGSSARRFVVVGRDSVEAESRRLETLCGSLLPPDSYSHRVARPGEALVTAVVVSHDDSQRLPACLDAISAQGMGNRVCVVVVCNVPGDGSARLVRSRYPHAIVVERHAPGGFAENQNLGLAAAPSEFGLALNPDVRMEPGCLAALVDLMRQRPRCGIASPDLRYPGGESQAAARRFPELVGTLVRRTPVRLAMSPARLAPAHYLPAPTRPRPVDWALGGCLLVRRAALEDLGGYDEGFRLYVEDIDVAWRAWQRGWEIWQTPDAVAVHEYQAVIDRQFLTVRTLWHLRGMGRFVRKHPVALMRMRPSLAEAAQASSR